MTHGYDAMNSLCRVGLIFSVVGLAFLSWCQHGLPHTRTEATEMRYAGKVIIVSGYGSTQQAIADVITRVKTLKEA